MWQIYEMKNRPGYIFFALNLLLLVVILCLFYHYRGEAAFNNLLSTNLAGICLLILPGLPWAYYFHARIPHRLFLLLPIAFLFSLMLYLPFSFAGFYFHLPTQVVLFYMMFAGVLSTVVGVGLILKRSRGEGTLTVSSILSLNRKDIFSFHVLTSFLLVIMSFTAFSGVFLDRGDGWLHMSIVKKLLDRNVMVAASPYFDTFQHDSNYGYCVWHVSLAALASFTGKEPAEVWFSIMPLLFFLSGYSLFGFGLYLFRRGALAAIYLLAHLWALTHFAGDLVGLRIFQYPYLTSPLIIMPVAWVLCFEFLRRGGRFFGILSIVACLVLVSVHKLSFMGFFLFLGLVCLLAALFGAENMRTRLRPIILIAAVCVGLLAFMLVVSPGPITNPFHKTFAANEVIKIGEWGLIAKPEVFLYRTGWVVYHTRVTWIPFLALAAVPFLMWRGWRRRKSGLAIRPIYLYCTAGMLLIPMVMANPVMGKLYASKFSMQALMRLYSNIPHFATVIAGGQIFLFFLLRRIKVRRLRRWCSKLPAVAVALVFIMMLARSWSVFHRGIENPQLFETWRITDPLPVALKELDLRVTEPAVVNTNPMTAYFVTALTKHYVVQVFATMTSPSMPDYDQRNFARDRILQLSASSKERAELLDKYRVEFLCLDFRRFKGVSPEGFWEKFDADEYSVRPMLRCGPVYVFALAKEK